MSAQDALLQQILSQGTTSKWSGGYGTDSAARDMARILSEIGITDIRQFGKVPTYTPVVERGKTYKGQYINEQGNEDGTVSRYIMEPTGRMTEQLIPGEGYYEMRPEYRQVTVPKDAKLESVYAIPNPDYVPFESPIGQFLPDQVTDVVIKNGQPVIKSGETFGNKVTGQTVPSTYGERQTGNAWGGTFAGSGNTGYRVEFAPDGTPVFYTTGASSNDLANIMSDIGPIGAIAANYLAFQLGGPAGVAALNAAQGKSAEDVLKSALLAYVGGEANSMFGGGGTDGLLGGTGESALDAGMSVYPTLGISEAVGGTALAGGAGGASGGAGMLESVFDPTFGGELAPVIGGGAESVFDPTFGGQLAPVIGGGAESVFDPTSGKSALDAGMDVYPSTGNIGSPSSIKLSDAKRALDVANKLTGGNQPTTPGGTAGTAAGANTAETALSNLLQQQTSNAALLNILGGKPELANIKSFKELFGEGLFGDSYVPPSASGAQPIIGQYADLGTASQNEGEEQLFTGGHVDDFDVDALLQILRS